MAWAYFQDQSAFDAYHNTVCAERGIPRPGRRQSDSQPRVQAQWTDAWVEPVQVEGKGGTTALIALVPDADVERFELPLADVTVDKATGITTAAFGKAQYVVRSSPGVTWRKAKPATTTVDGKTYNTTTGAVISASIP